MGDRGVDPVNPVLDPYRNRERRGGGPWVGEVGGRRGVPGRREVAEEGVGDTGVRVSFGRSETDLFLVLFEREESLQDLTTRVVWSSGG